jgi:ferredoxin
MKVQIDQNLCIGCGTCEALAPEVFKMGPDNKAEVKEGFTEEKNLEAIKQAIETCAVNAISMK